jgi:hypothetical protein
MNLNFEELYKTTLERLKGKGNQKTSLCPFHKDKNKSFTVNIKTGLWHCFAGCGSGNAKQFAKRMGIETMQNKNRHGMKATSRNPKKESENKKLKELKQIEKTRVNIFHKYLIENIITTVGEFAWTKEVINKLWVGYDSNTKRITFPYINQNKKLINIKWHKGPNGESPFSVKGHGQNTLYPMHLIINYSKQFLIYCEGEKDVLTLLSHGYNAVTHTTGAGSIPRDLSLLKSFERIAILLDNDEAGRKGTGKLANTLITKFPNIIIEKLYWPPGSPDKYDITDFFMDNRPNDFKEILKNKLGKGYAILNAIEFEKQEYGIPTPIVEEILTARGFGTIAGSDGVGKSLLALQFAICCALGVPFLDYNTLKPVKVLLLQFELDNAELLFRYKKMKYWFNQTYKVTPGKITNLDIVEIKEDIKLFTDQWNTIEQTLIDSTTNYDILIVDNLYTSTDKDVSANHELSKLLGRMDGIGRKYKIAMMLVNHYTKQQVGVMKMTKDMIRGGKSFTDWLTNAVQIGESTVSQDTRVFKVTKLRSGIGLTLNIAQELKFDPENLIFHRIGILEDESIHFKDTKNSPEQKAFEKIEEVAIEGIFTTKMFEKVVNEMEYSRNTAYRWLIKLTSWKKIKPRKHGEYEILKSKLEIKK